MSSSMLESGEDTKKVKDPTSDLVSEQDVGVSILSRGAALSESAGRFSLALLRGRNTHRVAVC